MTIDRFPRFPLGHWPTPLASMARLERHFKGPRLFVKRDDCTGLADGGNKTRKLEFLLADALAQGADTLLTHGAVQSNHVRQTAAAAALAGLACEALLEQRLSSDSEEYANSGNVFLDRILGATLHRVPGGTPMDTELERLAAKRTAEGRRPYVIPGGGSNALGALGYVQCVRELALQCDSQGLRKPHLVTASGSAGTHAGLAAGIRALGLNWPVSGIGVRLPRAAQEAKVHQLASNVMGLLQADGEVPRESITADDRFIGGGYGVPTAPMKEAVTLVARTEGILLDPVYTGKAMAGMIAMLREGRFASDEEVIFIHTGGSSALFGYRWAFTDAVSGPVC